MTFTQDEAGRRPREAAESGAKHILEGPSGEMERGRQPLILFAPPRQHATITKALEGQWTDSSVALSAAPLTCGAPNRKGTR